MDEARWALAGDDLPAENVRWADCLAIEAQQRLLDVTAHEMTLEISEFYPSKLQIPLGAACRLQLFNGNDKALGEKATTQITMLQATVRLPLAKLPKADYRLKIEILSRR